MKKFRAGKLRGLVFHQLSGFDSEIKHAFFGRRDGFSSGDFESLNVRYGIGDNEENVNKNRNLIRESMGYEKMISMNQNHGKNIAVIDRKYLEEIEKGGSKTPCMNIFELEGFDGMITDLAGVLMMVQVADCQAAIFFDTVRRVLGVAHAGWRGLRLNIYQEMIEKMVFEMGASRQNIFVGIGPSLGTRSAEFTNPIQEMGEEYKKFYRGRMVDLQGIAKAQIKAAGIAEDRIEIVQNDIATDSRFFSYRRDKGRTGRNCLVAGILESQ